MNKKYLIATIVVLGVILVSSQSRRFEGANTMSPSTATTIGTVGMIFGAAVFVVVAYTFYNYMSYVKD
jgi:drug/metabolite transporter (DMT)-like permease